MTPFRDEPSSPCETAPEHGLRSRLDGSPSVPFCGWFDSSEDLRRGLEVSELAWPTPDAGAACGPPGRGA